MIAPRIYCHTSNFQYLMWIVFTVLDICIKAFVFLFHYIEYLVPRNKSLLNIAEFCYRALWSKSAKSCLTPSWNFCNLASDWSYKLIELISGYASRSRQYGLYFSSYYKKNRLTEHKSENFVTFLLKGLTGLSS